jgi:cob(I)alamin adenosyltransferase
MSKGLIYIFTGNGKGKTSAALGMGLRAALCGKRVAMVCWYKNGDWQISEAGITGKLKNFKIYLMGRGFYFKELRAKGIGHRAESIGQRAERKERGVEGGVITDKASEAEHKEAAAEALKKAWGLMGKADVLILDEVCNAVDDGLMKIGEVLELIKKRGKTHLILTGRGAKEKLVQAADLVTEMKKVKHPFDRGVKAVKGLDF